MHYKNLGYLLITVFVASCSLAVIDASQRDNFHELCKYLLFGLFGWLLPSPAK
jgi:hypothetical protein